MEMHQIRYFLAAARTLNFTRAAEECNVAQPSLTRAIKQLEAELGGDLFRRERPQAQLTELGTRMVPLLRSRSVNSAHTHELSSERDLLSLLEANIGVAVVPRSIAIPETLTRLPLTELPLSRTVNLYAVAGRARGGPASTFMRQLNSADWTAYAS